MLKGGKRSNFYFILVLPIMVVFFYSIYPLRAYAGDIVINEIAWMGNLNSSYDEWIELKNLTGNNISLEGWTLVAQDGSPSINLTGSISSFGFFVLERSDDDSAPGVTADLIYIGALGNTGEVLELRDENGNLVDNLDNGSGWVGGDSDTKQTMMRNENGNWVTSEDVGGTPRALNSPIIASSESNNENSDGGDIATSTTGNNEEIEPLSTEATPSAGSGQAESDSAFEVDEVPDNNIFSLGDIVINEFVSDPADEEVEWIELYNNLDMEINLEGWTLEEGSSAKTKLEGVIGISGNNRYLVIEKPKGNLNNKGDIIILRDSLGKLIDKVTYGDWDDGDINDNAPYTTDPNSIARKINGYTSFNNKNDFALTTTLTKGKANIIKGEESDLEDEVSAEDKSKYDYSDDILISEIFPNPIGSDIEDEFVELFNNGTRDVDLTGWKLGDSSKKRFEIGVDDKLILRGGEYLVIYRSESGIALNNTTDSVNLFRPLDDTAFEVVEYNDVVEGWSFNKELSSEVSELSSYNGKWGWSEVVTPGEENVIKFINKAPEVSVDWPTLGTIGVPILFDSSDTIDEEKDKLKFFWDFGDGITNILASPEHTYFKAGAFTITLNVSDGENEVNEERIITVKSNDGITHPVAPRHPSQEGNFKVVINEILPNPEGTDSEGEWIEIKNMGIERINLLNWIIDDSEGGSKPFKFNSDLWLEPGELYTLDRVDSNIALNNSVDSVRLYSDLEELIDEIEYEKAVEGESYAKGENGKFFWTSVLTPGEENIIKLGSLKTLNTYESTENAGIGKDINSIEPLYISLDKITEAESGDTVITKGIVSVLPGILGTQYFYITSSLPSQPLPDPLLSKERGQEEGILVTGIQIYNYKKDFPDLRVGDYIEVVGEIGVTYGEKRIKTKVKEDMVILERGKEIEIKEYSCIDVNEEIVGSLIMVKGEIVERKSSVVYLDDGTDEVRLYIKSTTGINLKSLEEGGIITATGIVGMTKSGIRIMPRSPEDIIRGDIESSEDAVGQVLGEISVSDEWEIAKRDKKLELFKYVLVIAGTLIIVLGYLLFREIRG